MSTTEGTLSFEDEENSGSHRHESIAWVPESRCA